MATLKKCINLERLWRRLKDNIGIDIIEIICGEVKWTALYIKIWSSRRLLWIQWWTLGSTAGGDFFISCINISSSRITSLSNEMLFMPELYAPVRYVCQAYLPWHFAYIFPVSTVSSVNQAFPCPCSTVWEERWYGQSSLVPSAPCDSRLPSGHVLTLHMAW